MFFSKLFGKLKNKSVNNIINIENNEINENKDKTKKQINDIIDYISNRINLDKLFNNKKIKKKLFDSFMIILIISNISSLMGIVFLLKTNKDYKYTLEKYAFVQGDIGKLGIELEKTLAIMKDIISLENKDDILVEKARLDRRLELIDSYLPEVESKCVSEEEEVLVNSISKNLDKYRGILDEVVSLVNNGKKEDAEYIFKIKGDITENSLSLDIKDLMDIKISNGDKMTKKLTVLEFVSVIVTLLFLGTGILLTILLSVYISNKISNPIREVVNISKKLSEGDLDVSIEVKSNDEIGELANSFTNMVRSLRGYISELSSVLGSIEKGDLKITTSDNYKGNFIEMKNSLDNILNTFNKVFSEIQDAANSVNIGANQMSQTAQYLSEGSMSQTNSVMEILEHIKMINEKVNVTSMSSNMATELSNNCENAVKNSEKQMENMIYSMGRIAEFSSCISTIINDINEIAAQTDLLALNAAIEAARAGEAGKGFAVVADEVRDLASKSAEAARKTTALIQDTIEAIEDGKKVANDTAENLAMVAENVNKTTVIIEDIANASKEQSEAVAQITSEMDQISEVVQSNSATAEESASSSEELISQSEILNDMIKRFTIK